MVITSKDNQYIRLINELKKKKYREKYGLFLAEGKRLIEDLISASLLPHVILYTESFEDIGFLEKVCGYGDHVFAVEPRLFDKLTDTEHHQGILGAFPMLCPELDRFVPKENDLLLVLNGVSDPGNLGTIIRSAAAAEVGAVLMEEGCVDLYNPKVIRSTMGTVTKVPIFRGLSFDEIQSYLEKHRISGYLADMEQAISYDELPMEQCSAVIFGNEGNGIDKAWRSCGYPGVMIPMARGVESLNVAMAAGIIAFDHARRVRKNLK